MRLDVLMMWLASEGTREMPENQVGYWECWGMEGQEQSKETGGFVLCKTKKERNE